MCEDMEADNVLYAEIRTTPKVRSPYDWQQHIDGLRCHSQHNTHAVL